MLMISQVYVPDSASVGQHCADVAEEMARRGWEVRVLTASRGYDDPSLVFPMRETRNGVDIRRLPLSSFGKRSIPVRLLAQVLFMIQAVISGLLMRNVTAVFVSTSPPFAGFGGAIIHAIRRAPFLWWVMDLNPDQMVIAGKLRQTSLLVRVFDWMNRVTLRRAATVVALDSFMAARLNRKADVASKMDVMPPWPHHEVMGDDEGSVMDRLTLAGRAFRERNGFRDRFVVMYSGNHALQHPLDTLLDAAAGLEDDPSILFVFIGGGAGKRDVESRIMAGATNVMSLPYQPLDTLDESLGAADIHVVSMGSDVVGVVHPCKIYGAMAVGRPILFLGPSESHAGAIIEPRGIGWRVTHGDVGGAIAAIRAAAAMPREQRLKMGSTAVRTVSDNFSRSMLLSRMCDHVERLATARVQPDFRREG